MVKTEQSGTPDVISTSSDVSDQVDKGEDEKKATKHEMKTKGRPPVLVQQHEREVEEDEEQANEDESASLATEPADDGFEEPKRRRKQKKRKQIASLQEDGELSN